MKDNISKNKVWQIVGVSVLCAVLVLGAVLGVVFGMHHSTEDLNVSKDMSSDDIVVSATEENGIMLTSGVATTAADGTTTKELTATVTPSEASSLRYAWSIAFVNPSSTWATGKNVTDYVSISQDGSNQLKATVTFKKLFSEQIKVTVSCVLKPEIKASATVDCYKKLTDIVVKYTADNAESVSCKGLNYGYYQEEDDTTGYFTYADYTTSINYAWGEGTINGEITCKVSFGDGSSRDIPLDVFHLDQILDDYEKDPLCVVLSFYYNGELVTSHYAVYRTLPTNISFATPSIIF